MRRSVSWLVFLAALGLAACGGGGSGGGGSTLGATVAPATSAPQLPAVPSSVQRSDIQTGLQSVTSGQNLVSYGSTGGSSTLGLGHSVKRAMARDWTQSVTCQNGFTESIVSTGPNSATVTDQYFYDAGCSKLWKNVVASVNLTLGTASGSATVFSIAGSVIAFDTLGLAVAKTSTTEAFSIELTAAANQSATPYAAVGLSCSGPLSGGSAACGAAGTESLTSISTMVGVTLNLSGTLTAVAGGGETLNLTDSASAYAGGLGALTIAQGTAVTWVVNGGSAIDSASGSGTATYAANGLITSFSINVSDPTYSAVLAVSGNANGASGSLTQGSTVLASFTLDNAGNGTISFANGAQEQVQGYYITS